MTEDKQEGVWPFVGAVLCGVLILAIVATTVAAFNFPDAALGLGLIFIVFLPLASIPVGLFCLVGAVKSGVALRRHPSPAARVGLWLSLAGPIAVLACYAACFVMLSKWELQWDNFSLLLMIVAAGAAAGGLQQRQHRKPFSIALGFVAFTALLGLVAYVAMFRNG